MIKSIQTKENRKYQIRKVTHHPYFGFFILAFVMLLVRLVQYFGVNISGTVMDAFGLTMIYIVIALGFAILLGYAGLASLGTAGFVGVGAYMLGYLTNKVHLSIFLVILITIAFAILIGLIVGFISLRIEGMYLAIITLGIAETLTEVFKNATEITNGINSLIMRKIILFGQPIAMEKDTTFIFLTLILFLMMVFTWNIIKSPTGRAMLAMKNSESAAQAMGVSVFKYRLLAFIISTVFALLGGTLYMTYVRSTVYTTWNLALSLNILAAVIVGGSSSIYGIVIGTFLIFGLDLAVLKQNQFFIDNPAISVVFNGILIILVIMFYPGGLVRLFTTLKYKLGALIKRLTKKWRDYKYGSDSE